MSRCYSPVLALLLASACTIVDEGPYQALPESMPDGPDGPDAGPVAFEAGLDAGDTGVDGPTDAGPDATPDATLPGIFEQVTFNDRCDDEYRKFLPPGKTSLMLDTTHMANDVDLSAGLACVEHGLDTPGNDGFIAVNMRFGDVWHIHMIPDESPDAGGKDPALYVLDSLCDVRKCDFGIDYCRATEHEHFTFVARNDGVHYLGIDDRNPGGGRYSFSATRVECGNGEPQHGKACDATNPNDMNKDKCDNECRIVLHPKSNNQTFESGVHDDFTVANVIEFPADGAPIVDVVGDIRGCTADYYTFTAQAGQSLKVTWLDEHAVACSAAEADRFVMQLMDATDKAMQTGEATAENACPGLTRDDLAEGRYYVKLSDTLETGLTETFGYTLRIELSPP